MNTAPGAGGAVPKQLDVDAVVFDMDGLLLNTEILANRGLHLAGAELGLDMPQWYCFQMIGVPADGCRRMLIERFGPDVPADRFFALAGQHLLSQIDRGLLELRPGVIRLLDYLDRERVPRAVATSSGATKTRHHLKAAGILDRFDTIVTRDDVARGKPYPDLFLRAARCLGVPAARCLALEDSHNGVRAAHAAAMPVIMIPDLLPPNAEMREKCHAVLDRVDAVLELLTRPASRGSETCSSSAFHPQNPQRSTR